MTKILHLTLKRKWFDMIASGEKKEEYRDLKPYWGKRLTKLINFEYIDGMEEYMKNGKVFYQDFDVIYFKNGYATNAPMMVVEFKEISIGWGIEKWGAKSRLYFIIKLGTILNIENYGENGTK